MGTFLYKIFLENGILVGGLSRSHKRKGIMIFTLLVASTVVLLEN